MSRSKPFKTVVAALTGFVFFVTSLGISPNAFAAASMPEVSLPYQAAIERNLRVAIPQELGKLESFSAGSGPAVFHIQTAHGNYQAQQQVRAILHHLEESYGVKTLLVEGGVDELRSDVLNFFPADKKLTMKIADLFTKHALVTGEELYLLDEVQKIKGGLAPRTSGLEKTKNSNESRVPSPESRALGIENLKSYLANGEAFAATLRQKEKTDQFLRDMNEGIERIQSAYLNDTLRGFLKRLEAYEKNLTPIDAWLNYMRGEALKHLRLDLTNPGAQIDWPMMIRIFKIQELNAKLDRQQFPKEREAFLKALRRFMLGTEYGVRSTAKNSSAMPSAVHRTPYDAIEELLQSDSMSVQLPDPETSLLFEDMVRQLPPNFNYDAFPNVRYFIGLLLLQSELKAASLMREAEALSGKILEKLAKTEVEKTLVALLKDYSLLQKLFALELTPGDYEEIIGRKAQSATHNENALKPSLIAKRFEDVERCALSVARVKAVKFDHVKDLDQLYDSALKFYEGAKTRDKEMIAGVERRIQETGATKVAVITGGFHAGPFKEYFSAKDYNYMLISPRITSADDAGKLDYVRTVMAAFKNTGLGTRNSSLVKAGFESRGTIPESQTYLLRALQPVEEQPVSSRVIDRALDIARAEVRDPAKLDVIRAALAGKPPARGLPAAKRETELALYDGDRAYWEALLFDANQSFDVVFHQIGMLEQKPEHERSRAEAAQLQNLNRQRADLEARIRTYRDRLTINQHFAQIAAAATPAVSGASFRSEARGEKQATDYRPKTIDLKPAVSLQSPVSSLQSEEGPSEARGDQAVRVGVPRELSPGRLVDAPWQVERWKKDDEPVEASMVWSLMDQKKFGRIVQGGLWRAFYAITHGKNQYEKVGGEVELAAIVRVIQKHPFQKDVLAYLRFHDNFGAMPGYLSENLSFSISDEDLIRMFMDYSRFEDVRRFVEILKDDTNAVSRYEIAKRDLNAVLETVERHPNFRAYGSFASRVSGRSETRGLRPLFMAGLAALASFWMTTVATAQTVFPGKPRLETYGDGGSGRITQYNSARFLWTHDVLSDTWGKWTSATMNFASGQGVQNLSGFNEFQFSFRGYNDHTTGNQCVFSVEFQDTDGDMAKAFISGIYDDDFQTVTLSKSSLGVLPGVTVNWDRIKAIAFVVNNGSYMPRNFSGWLEVKTGGLYFFTPPIAPDPDLFPYDTTAFPGPVWPTIVKPGGATAIATPTERGASFFLRTYGGTDNWAGGGFTFDNPATPQVETGDMRGFANQVYTLYGDHFGVKMEVVDAAENKESVQLISIDASPKTWAIPENAFGSVDLGRVKVIYFIVEGFYQTGTLNVDHISQSLVMSGVTYANGTAQVSFPSYAGADYKIEYRNDLTSGEWLPAETITAAGPQTTWIDNGSKTGAPSSKRFYQVIYLARSEVRDPAKLDVIRAALTGKSPTRDLPGELTQAQDESASWLDGLSDAEAIKVGMILQTRADTPQKLDGRSEMRGEAVPSLSPEELGGRIARDLLANVTLDVDFLRGALVRNQGLPSVNVEYFDVAQQIYQTLSSETGFDEAEADSFFAEHRDAIVAALPRSELRMWIETAVTAGVIAVVAGLVIRVIPNARLDPEKLYPLATSAIRKKIETAMRKDPAYFGFVVEHIFWEKWGREFLEGLEILLTQGSPNILNERVRLVADRRGPIVLADYQAARDQVRRTGGDGVTISNAHKDASRVRVNLDILSRSEARLGTSEPTSFEKFLGKRIDEAQKDLERLRLVGLMAGPVQLGDVLARERSLTQRAAGDRKLLERLGDARFREDLAAHMAPAAGRLGKPFRSEARIDHSRLTEENAESVIHQFLMSELQKSEDWFSLSARAVFQETAAAVEYCEGKGFFIGPGLLSLYHTALLHLERFKELTASFRKIDQRYGQAYWDFSLRSEIIESAMFFFVPHLLARLLSPEGDEDVRKAAASKQFLIAYQLRDITGGRMDLDKLMKGPHRAAARRFNAEVLRELGVNLKRYEEQKRFSEAIRIVDRVLSLQTGLQTILGDDSEGRQYIDGLNDQMLEYRSRLSKAIASQGTGSVRSEARLDNAGEAKGSSLSAGAPAPISKDATEAQGEAFSFMRFPLEQGGVKEYILEQIRAQGHSQPYRVVVTTADQKRIEIENIPSDFNKLDEQRVFDLALVAQIMFQLQSRTDPEYDVRTIGEMQGLAGAISMMQQVMGSSLVISNRSGPNSLLARALYFQLAELYNFILLNGVESRAVFLKRKADFFGSLADIKQKSSDPDLDLVAELIPSSVSRSELRGEPPMLGDPQLWLSETQRLMEQLATRAMAARIYAEANRSIARSAGKAAVASVVGLSDALVLQARFERLKAIEERMFGILTEFEEKVDGVERFMRGEPPENFDLSPGQAVHSVSPHELFLEIRDLYHEAVAIGRSEEWAGPVLPFPAGIVEGMDDRSALKAGMILQTRTGYPGLPENSFESASGRFEDVVLVTPANRYFLKWLRGEREIAASGPARLFLKEYFSLWTLEFRWEAEDGNGPAESVFEIIVGDDASVANKVADHAAVQDIVRILEGVRKMKEVPKGFDGAKLALGKVRFVVTDLARHETMPLLGQEHSVSVAGHLPVLSGPLGILHVALQNVPIFSRSEARGKMGAEATANKLELLAANMSLPEEIREQAGALMKSGLWSGGRQGARNLVRANRLFAEARAVRRSEVRNDLGTPHGMGRSASDALRRVDAEISGLEHAISQLMREPGTSDYASRMRVLKEALKEEEAKRIMIAERIRILRDLSRHVASAGPASAAPLLLQLMEWHLSADSQLELFFADVREVLRLPADHPIFSIDELFSRPVKTSDWRDSLNETAALKAGMIAQTLADAGVSESRRSARRAEGRTEYDMDRLASELKKFSYRGVSLDRKKVLKLAEEGRDPADIASEAFKIVRAARPSLQALLEQSKRSEARGKLGLEATANKLELLAGNLSLPEEMRERALALMKSGLWSGGRQGARNLVRANRLFAEARAVRRSESRTEAVPEVAQKLFEQVKALTPSSSPVVEWEILKGLERVLGFVPDWSEALTLRTQLRELQDLRFLRSSGYGDTDYGRKKAQADLAFAAERNNIVSEQIYRLKRLLEFDAENTDARRKLQSLEASQAAKPDAVHFIFTPHSEDADFDAVSSELEKLFERAKNEGRKVRVVHEAGAIDMDTVVALAGRIGEDPAQIESLLEQDEFPKRLIEKVQHAMTVSRVNYKRLIEKGALPEAVIRSERPFVRKHLRFFNEHADTLAYDWEPYDQDAIYTFLRSQSFERKISLLWTQGDVPKLLGHILNVECLELISAVLRDQRLAAYLARIAQAHPDEYIVVLRGFKHQKIADLARESLGDRRRVQVISGDLPSDSYSRMIVAKLDRLSKVPAQELLDMPLGGFFSKEEVREILSATLGQWLADQNLEYYKNDQDGWEKILGAVKRALGQEGSFFRLMEVLGASLALGSGMAGLQWLVNEASLDKKALASFLEHLPPGLKVSRSEVRISAAEAEARRRLDAEEEGLVRAISSLLKDPSASDRDERIEGLVEALDRLEGLEARRKTRGIMIGEMLLLMLLAPAALGLALVIDGFTPGEEDRSKGKHSATAPHRKPIALDHARSEMRAAFESKRAEIVAEFADRVQGTMDLKWAVMERNAPSIDYLRTHLNVVLIRHGIDGSDGWLTTDEFLSILAEIQPLKLPVMKAHRPVVVLMGKAGSGKGTVSGRFLKSTDMVHISTGNLLREAVAAETPAGREAKDYMKRGELVPDSVVIKILEEEFLHAKHNGRGFVFDGFPRNVAQARELDKFLARLGFSVDFVLLIDISNEDANLRLSQRWECPKCHATFNNDVMKPKTDGVCDHDGTALVHRPDDMSPEAVEKRFGEFMRYSPDILKHYEVQGKVVTVSAELGSEAIAEALIESYRANRSETRQEAATYRIAVGLEGAEFEVEIVDRDEAADVSVPANPGYHWQGDDKIVDYKGRIYFGTFDLGAQKILVLYDPKPGVKPSDRWAVKGVTEEGEFVGIDVTSEILDAVEEFKRSKLTGEQIAPTAVEEEQPVAAIAPSPAASALPKRLEFARLEMSGFKVIVYTNIIGKNEIVVEGEVQPTAAQMTEIQAKVAKLVAENAEVREAKRKAVESLRPPVTHAGTKPAAFTVPSKKPPVYVGNMLAGTFGVRVFFDAANPEKPNFEFMKEPKPTPEQMPAVEAAIQAWFDKHPTVATLRAKTQPKAYVEGAVAIPGAPKVAVPAVKADPVVLGKVLGSDFTVEILYTPGLEPYSKAQDPKRFSLRAQQTPKQIESAKKEGRAEPSGSDLKGVVPDIQAWINGDPMLKARVDVAVRTADMGYAHKLKEAEARVLAKEAAKAIKPEGEAARPETMAELTARLEAQGDFWVENADKYVEALIGKTFKDTAKRENASRVWKAFVEKHSYLVGVQDANGAQTGETKHGDLKKILEGVRDILSEQKTFKVLILVVAGAVLLFSGMGLLFSVKAAIGLLVAFFIPAAGVILWRSGTRDELLRAGELWSLKLLEFVLEKETLRRQAEAKGKQRAASVQNNAAAGSRSEMRGEIPEAARTVRFAGSREEEQNRDDLLRQVEDLANALSATRVDEVMANSEIKRLLEWLRALSEFDHWQVEFVGRVLGEGTPDMHIRKLKEVAARNPRIDGLLNGLLTLHRMAELSYEPLRGRSELRDIALDRTLPVAARIRFVRGASKEEEGMRSLPVAERSVGAVAVPGALRRSESRANIVPAKTIEEMMTPETLKLIEEYYFRIVPLRMMEKLLEMGDRSVLVTALQRLLGVPLSHYAGSVTYTTVLDTQIPGEGVVYVPGILAMGGLTVADTSVRNATNVRGALALGQDLLEEFLSQNPRALYYLLKNFMTETGVPSLVTVGSPELIPVIQKQLMKKGVVPAGEFESREKVLAALAKGQILRIEPRKYAGKETEAEVLNRLATAHQGGVATLHLSAANLVGLNDGVHFAFGEHIGSEDLMVASVLAVALKSVADLIRNVPDEKLRGALLEAFVARNLPGVQKSGANAFVIVHLAQLAQEFVKQSLIARAA